MAEWVNWSGSVRAPANEIKRPQDLRELIEVVSAVGGREGRIHAEGSRWAFSAPAYCDDVIVDTSALNGFPKLLQRAIRKPTSTRRHLVAVEAGIKIRDLYRALAFDADRGYIGPLPSVPRDGRIWTLPVLGGAGGQSLAGAINTGTHGGDAARAPLSDAVLAILLVASGGRLLLIEPAAPDTVDVPELSAGLGIAVQPHYDAALFNAALVSVGRLGIVWAYVLQVHDETRVAIVEERSRSTWQGVGATLVSDAAGAASRDEFLQVAINPLRRDDGGHTCFVTRHFMQPGHPTDADAAPYHRHVVEARRTTECALVFQALGSPRVHAVLATLPIRLPALGLASPVVGVQVAARLAEIGTVRPNGDRYLSGDAFADILKDIRWLDPSWAVLRAVQAEALELEQRAHIVQPDEPWQVKGTRFEIADIYNYDAPDGYRGDSTELFFGVDPGNPADLRSTIDELLDVFDRLRVENLPVVAYLSIRFMAGTRATLGMARWPLTCSVEVAMLRAMPGNARLLRLLQEVTLARRGVVHWGQQNDVEAPDVAAGFGTALDDFRAQIPKADPFRLFRNRFTLTHGLEPIRPASWARWIDLGHVGRSAAALPLGFEAGVGMQVFAKNAHGVVEALALDGLGQPAGTWREVRPEPVSGRPVVFRGAGGRLELFSIDDDVLKHTFQTSVGGTRWSTWNVKGWPDPGRFDPQRSQLSVAAHGDGRLEVFGKSGWERNFRLAHCWAHARDGAWGTVHYRGSRTLASAPSAANHRPRDGLDVLAVAATTSNGEIVAMVQTNPADDAGWSDWHPVTTEFPSWATGGPALVAPPDQAMHLFVVGPRDRLMLGTTTHPELMSWTFMDLNTEVDPVSRIAAIFHGDRIWVATRSPEGDVLCGAFAPGTAPVMNRLDAFTLEDVALGGYPSSPDVQIVARTLDGRLLGQRLKASS